MPFFSSSFFVLILWIFVLIFGIGLFFSPSMGSRWIWKRCIGDWATHEVKTLLLDKLLQYKWLTKPRWLVRQTVSREKLRQKILRAGTGISESQFLGLKQLLVTFFSFYFWMYLWFGTVQTKTTLLLLFLYGVAYMIPDLWLQVQKEKREKQFHAEVPYFIDLLSLTLQTGMNVEQALGYISSKKKGVLSLLVKDQMRSLSFGKSLESVLQHLRESVPIPDWKNFISSIQQSKKLGVSLAHTLEIQSEIIRTRRRQRAEELSRTAAVKISIPLVLFIFPALLIIYIGPGLIRLMG